MASKATTGVFKQIEVLFQTGLASELTDGQLLDRFTRGGGPGDAIAEAAFATLVDRHGAMVLRVCRGILNEGHAAEDAAQATFLVLARRAGSIARRDSIAAWLQGVAVRVAKKARIAEMRRRLRERRVAEEASRSAEPTFEDSDRWLELHQELGRLPETFRAPLVLCYLEGLTQEQAAARLRCPLGTVQSRLARGRERLKARLIGRGVSPISGFLVPGFEIPGFRIVPASWGGATTRAAIQFITQGSGAVQAGACPASAGLALEVLRDMGFLKLKIALTAILTSAMVATGAAGFWMAGEADPPKPAAEVAKPEPKPAPIPAPKPKPPADRVIAGIVRDDQGRPMAKVWVGSELRAMQDDWKNPSPRDIRERKEPFHDPKGEIIPPGEVGKYFELRDPKGTWNPISPDDIRPWDAIVWGDKGVAVSKEEVAKNHSRYMVRAAKGGWWMAGESLVGGKAIRTDGSGRFTIKMPIDNLVQAKLHFASTDSTFQAIHILKSSDPVDQPLDIKLRPTRLVRARIIETPKDDPKASLTWTIYTVDAVGKPEHEWQRWYLPDPNAHDPAHMKRHLDVRLPVGRYRLELQSETVHRVVDLLVPPGNGPLDLPDFKVESLATVRMIGKPAAEIHAADLEGKPVKLADFRGKVIVLDFWANWCGPCVAAMPKLIKLQERFRDRPIVFLALHDGSVDGPAAYEKAVAPIKDRFWDGADLPLRVLLDRPLEGEKARFYDSPPGSRGSGWSADTYEVTSWPSTFVIAADGRMVGKFELEKLEGILEDQLGLPRSKPVAEGTQVSNEPPGPGINVKVKGKVIGPDGKPVGGAFLWPQNSVVRQKEIRTDADGAFEYTAEKILFERSNGIQNFHMRVEARNLAPKVFKIDVQGPIDVTLKLGVGLTITGRVMRDRKPVANASVQLQQHVTFSNHFLGFPKTKTDATGHFRFEHAFPDDDLCCSVQLKSPDQRGVVAPRNFRSSGEGTTQDLGDLEVRPGHKLAGRIVFADGKTVPPGAKIIAWTENAGGPDPAKVGAYGRFEVFGLSDGVVGCSVRFPDIKTWLPDGYRLSAKNQGVSPLSPYMIYGLFDRDVDDFTILFEPGEPPRSPNLDPSLLADFEEAKKLTIRGVPPGSVK